LGDVNRYPDMAAAEVTSAIAEFLGEPPERIAIGIGSSSLIRDFISLVAGPGDEILFASPSFPYYRNATIAAGATPVAVPLREHRHDLRAMLSAIDDSTRIVIVCNPNNPTGTVVDPGEIADFIAQVPPRVAVVLDEAYLEFCDAGDHSIQLARQHQNVVVLRTFSKAYGLAGLRIGYMIGPAELVSWVRRIGVPFGVSHLAQVGVIASLRPSAQLELKSRIEEVGSERKRVEQALKDMEIPLVHSHANFVFLPLDEKSGELAAACESVGVMVRVIGGGVRATVGTRAENDRFVDAARGWWKASRS
jgi:histidinol-phosphate aminotransferase